MFAAALTGQDTFVKAVGVQEDYAAGLEKTSKNTNQAAKNTKKANKETEGYLSALDEIQRYTSNKNDDSAADGNGIGDTGGYTAPTPAQMFKKVPVANSIKGIADKIKKLIKSEDWEGLGKYIASGINKGLKKVYEAISWKKVGPKITRFCDAFTRTFNSLVDNVDWKLLGRTVGAGINTIVNTLNLLITGIDWKNLGKKFAEGITGLVKEVNWNNLGQLIANRFMITWDIFNGMVHNLPFSEIGKAIADGLNGICSRVSFREIADTLATSLNGAFTTLYSFTRRFDWTGLVNNIAGGINTFISEFDWKNNGRKLEAFLNSLCSSLVDMAEKTDWEAFGQGIGEMLGQINWVKHLKQVITAITRTLGGLFDGLEASGTAGKIAAFLGKAFIAVKIADITGIGRGISAEAREDILVQAFLTCPNISEISKKTKIPRPTIYTVIHTDSFQRKYSEARNEAVTGAIAYLQGKLGECAAVLVDTATDTEVPAQIRVNAANAALSQCSRSTITILDQYWEKLRFRK